MTKYLEINGVLVRTPSKFNISRFNLTKSGRVASGKMKMDLVAKKRKLSVEYEVISGSELQQILDIIDTDRMFFTVRYMDHSGWHSITCYVGEIPSEYFRIQMGWYYRGVQFSLIEQ